MEHLDRNIYQLSQKLKNLEARRRALMCLQLDNDCLCNSKNLNDLSDQIAGCTNILTEIKACLAGNPLWVSPLDCVERMLNKALQCITECQPKECEPDCRQSCALIRTVTTPYLTAKPRIPCETLPKLVGLLKVIRETPCFVLCNCSSHLNSVELYGYIHIAYSVVVDILHPLSNLIEETFAFGELDNCLLEEGSIHMAALKKSVPETIEAIKKGKNINSRDRSGHTALHIATILEDFGVAQKLVELGCDSNIPNVSGSTPLLLATITQQTQLVQMLCRKSQRPRLYNNDGFSPIMMAVALKDKQLLEILVTNSEMLYTHVYLAWMDECVNPPKTKDALDEGPGMSGKSAKEIECEKEENVEEKE